MRRPYLYILFLLLLLSCKGQHEVRFTPKINTPKITTQWINPLTIHQFTNDFDYTLPYLLDDSIRDSLNITSYSLFILINNELGHRLEKNIRFEYAKSGSIQRVHDELKYNHILYNQLTYIYPQQKGKKYSTPTVTHVNSIPVSKKISLDLHKNFLANTHQSLSEYVSLNDSIVFKKTFDKQLVIYSETTDFENYFDTLPFGTTIFIGRPDAYSKSYISVPYFGWIPSLMVTFHQESLLPLSARFFEKGLLVKRDYHYNKAGFFTGCTDMFYGSTGYIRKRLIRLEYDSINQPKQLLISQKYNSGKEEHIKTFRWDWEK